MVYQILEALICLMFFETALGMKHVTTHSRTNYYTLVIPCKQENCLSFWVTDISTGWLSLLLRAGEDEAIMFCPVLSTE